VDLETVLTSIADGVRYHRSAAGLTLEQLAERSGLSIAHLSRIESGDRQPSLGALISLARALGVSTAALLGEEGGNPALATYPGEEPVRHTVNGLTVEGMSGFPGSRVIESLRVTVDPGREPPAFARHRGEEWIYVLEGRLRLEHDGEAHVLDAGTSVHFDADRPHRLGAIGGSAHVLIVTADAPLVPAPFSALTDH
jgi:quercetin dioxygenase-like cupin family protein